MNTNYNQNNISNKMSLVAALFCVMATGIGFGLSLPLLSFVMKDMGYSSFIIGLNTAMPALAAFLLSPIFLKGIEKFGLKTFIIQCAIFAVLCFWGFVFSKNILFWFAIRFVFGACLDGIFVASETWIGELIHDDVRGRIMGIFSSCLSIGYFLGAGILSLTGSHGYLPFIIGTVIFFVVMLPVLFSGSKIPDVKNEESTLLKPIIFAAPLAMGAAVVYGYLETSAFNLLPLYGVYNGLTEQISVSLLIAVGIGQACLQYFVGAIADKWGSWSALFLCAITGILGALGIGLCIHVPLVLYPILFFWGACISGFYTLALIIVGKQFKHSSLAGANSAVVAMFGLGSLIGPPMAGVGMEFSQKFGFIIAMLIPAVVYFFVLIRANRCRKPI